MSELTMFVPFCEGIARFIPDWLLEALCSKWAFIVAFTVPIIGLLMAENPGKQGGPKEVSPEEE